MASDQNRSGKAAKPGAPRQRTQNPFGEGASERRDVGQRCGHGAANEDMLGGHDRSQRVSGKRTRDESQAEEDDIGSATKRAKVTGQATSPRPEPDEADYKQLADMMVARVRDPNPPNKFSLPDQTTEWRTVITAKAIKMDEWNILADVGRSYLERGFNTVIATIKPMAVQHDDGWSQKERGCDTLIVTMKPMAVQHDDRRSQKEKPMAAHDTRRRQYGKPMDPTNARVINEPSSSEDSESALCEACEATSHETKDCPIPSYDGDTVVDPFCNLSIKAQEKGDTTHHSLDGKRATHPQHKETLLYCPTLISFERAEGTFAVVKLFNTLVVNRRRMPPIRVFKDQYCFIQIAIFASDYYCGGEMPRALEGVWPYTKQDALKHRFSFKSFDKLGWRGMPKGELEGMDWEEIKREYRAGRIPKQIHCGRREPVTWS